MMIVSLCASWSDGVAFEWPPSVCVASLGRPEREGVVWQWWTAALCSHHTGWAPGGQLPGEIVGLHAAARSNTSRTDGSPGRQLQPLCPQSLVASASPQI